MEAARPILAEYGALGVVLFVAFLAIRILFQRETASHQRDSDRADRMEAEVKRLNDAIQDKMLPVLHAATEALSDALQEQRRRDRQ